MDLFFVLLILTLGLYSVDTTCNSPENISGATLVVVGSSPYPDGTQVEYTCNIGYRPYGDSRIYTCQGGVLFGNFECKKITCSYKAPPVNGRYSTSPTYEIGTEMRLECYSGYDRNGPSRLLCMVDGTWDPDQETTCTPKNCRDFGSVMNGDARQNIQNGIRNSYGSVVTITCNEGHVIVGSSHVECQASGSWGAKPSCELVGCPTYPGASTGCVDYTELSSNKRFLVILCKSGPNISVTQLGYYDLYCNDNHEWEGDPLACYCDCKVVVNETQVTVNNLESNGFLKHGRTLSWTCKKGLKNMKENVVCKDGVIGTNLCINQTTTTSTTASTTASYDTKTRSVAGSIEESGTYDPKLDNTSSPEYLAKKQRTEEELKRLWEALFGPNATMNATVTGFGSGSTVTIFVISFRRRSVVSGNAVVELTKVDVQTKLMAQARRLSSFLETAIISILKEFTGSSIGRADLDETCTTTQDCQDINTECMATKCKCLDTHYDSNGDRNGGICQLSVFQPISCSIPPLVDNAVIVSQSPENGLEENGYRTGDTVKLECNSFYRMKGSKSMTCTSQGTWNTADPPVCVLKVWLIILIVVLVILVVVIVIVLLIWQYRKIKKVISNLLNDAKLIAGVLLVKKTVQEAINTLEGTWNTLEDSFGKFVWEKMKCKLTELAEQMKNLWKVSWQNLRSQVKEDLEKVEKYKESAAADIFQAGKEFKGNVDQLLKSANVAATIPLYEQHGFSYLRQTKPENYVNEQMKVKRRILEVDAWSNAHWDGIFIANKKLEEMKSDLNLLKQNKNRKEGELVSLNSQKERALEAEIESVKTKIQIVKKEKDNIIEDIKTKTEKIETGTEKLDTLKRTFQSDASWQLFTPLQESLETVMVFWSDEQESGEVSENTKMNVTTPV